MSDRVESVAECYSVTGGAIGAVNQQAIDTVCKEASAIGVGFVLGGFSQDMIDQFVADPRWIGALADIGISLSYERKREWRDAKTGKFPYCERRERGETTLKAIGLGIQRLGKEADTGENVAINHPEALSEPSRGWQCW
jgi:hypothetical protein